MTEERQLLAEYARTGSEDAFREIVRRFLGLVYSTALRLVSTDTHLAEDVSQIVFTDLARAARSLSPQVMLGGWLHRHTCFVAANVTRADRRRQFREEKAAEMNATDAHATVDFSRLAPVLDDAINQLEEEDRAAILLRFYEQRNFAAVAQAIGTSEDAARMRMNRALDKLQVLLKQRGVTATAAALATLLIAQAVQAVPTALVVSVTAAALATTAATSTAMLAAKVITMTTLQKAAVTTALSLTIGAGVFEAAQTSRLNSQLAIVQQNRAQNLAQFQSQLTDASNRISLLAHQNADLHANSDEVTALRGEVTRLRGQTNELGRLRQENREIRDGLTQMMQHPEQNPLNDPNTFVSIRQSEDARKFGVWLVMSAADHQNRYPTNFTDLASYWTNEPVAPDFSPFDYLAPGYDLTSILKPAMTILLRSKQISVVAGKRTRIYGYADGHANILAEPPEGFDAWEQNHLPPSAPSLAPP